MPAKYLVVWEFQIKPGLVEEFERVYGSSGDWAALFHKSPEYLGTELLRDLDRAGRYLTIDSWASREALRQFKQEHAAEYASLDRQCEHLTVEEGFLGDFELPISATEPSRRL